MLHDNEDAERMCVNRTLIQNANTKAKMTCLNDQHVKMSLPLLNHPLDLPSVFTPETVVEGVRMKKHVPTEPIPPVCVLEFDGELTDWLVSIGAVKTSKSLACFHTTMFLLEIDGFTCGIVPRTIGGAYAVLIAEQMAVSGAHVVIGLASAGRVSSRMPMPGLVVITRAIRDEGTSHHYLPQAELVTAPPEVARLLESELQTLPLPVLSGTVWTTDAPYRETERQLADYANAGVMAVEMQAASLFAFSEARRFPTGMVAYVTNGVGQPGKPFDKGTQMLEFDVLKRVCRAGMRFVLPSRV